MLYPDDVNYWKEVADKHHSKIQELHEKLEELTEIQVIAGVLTLQNELLQAENKDLKETIDKMHEYIPQGRSDG